MAAPANIRANVQVPFPATVVGGAPVVIAKQSGVWTVALSTAAVGQLTVLPSGALILAYNPNPPSPTWFVTTITSLASALVSATQRSVVNATVTIQASDQILNLNLNAPQTITLPLASGRNGASLTFHDAGGQFLAHPVTLSRSGSDLINGQTTFVLNANYQSVTIAPYTDGVNAGWFII